MLLKEILSNPKYSKKSIIEKLLMHRVDITKEQLFTSDSLRISEDDFSWIEKSYLAITQDHRPIEYVMGYCEFSGHRFGVTEATLIPRPETEYMIEAVREWIGDSSLRSEGQSKIILLDIGTGCGVLGLSTLLHCGSALQEAMFTDLSSDALGVAQGNYKKFLDVGLIQSDTPPVAFIECSLMDHKVIKEVFRQSFRLSDAGAIEGSGGINNTSLYGNGQDINGEDTEQDSTPRSDGSDSLLIVANLPYIPDGLFEDNTDPSVHKREPKMAFVGGDDGMDLYRIMLEQIVQFVEDSTTDEGTKHLSSGSSNATTLFLEMMTRQVAVLRKEFGEWFEFEEVKTFHFNIRIVKAVIR